MSSYDVMGLYIKELGSDMTGSYSHNIGRNVFVPAYSATFSGMSYRGGGSSPYYGSGTYYYRYNDKSKTITQHYTFISYISGRSAGPNFAQHMNMKFVDDWNTAKKKEKEQRKRQELAWDAGYGYSGNGLSNRRRLPHLMVYDGDDGVNLPFDLKNSRDPFMDILNIMRYIHSNYAAGEITMDEIFVRGTYVSTGSYNSHHTDKTWVTTSTFQSDGAMILLGLNWDNHNVYIGPRQQIIKTPNGKSIYEIWWSGKVSTYGKTSTNLSLKIYYNRKLYERVARYIFGHSDEF